MITAFDDYLHNKTDISDNEEITLRKCSLLKEYVFSKYSKYLQLCPSPFMLGDYRSICYESSAVALGMDFDTVSDFFHKRYHSVLVDKHYSCDVNTKKWRSFNETELFEIGRIAKSLQDQDLSSPISE